MLQDVVQRLIQQPIAASAHGRGNSVDTLNFVF